MYASLLSARAELWCPFLLGAPACVLHESRSQGRLSVECEQIRGTADGLEHSAVHSAYVACPGEFRPHCV